MRNLLLSSLITTLFAPMLHATTVEKTIDALINEHLPQAHVGIIIQDPETHQVIYQRNPKQFFLPASTIKLFTATAALYQLGTNFRYATSLQQLNQDIYFHFSGSPSFTIDDLNYLVAYLKSSQATLKGNIILDASAFKQPYYPSGISYDDLGWYFAAPSTAVILNENAFRVDIITNKTLGKPVQLVPKTQPPFVQITQDVTTVTKAEEKEHCNLNVVSASNNTLHLYGCIAQNDKPIPMHFAIPDPLQLAKNFIQQALHKEHITFNGKIITGKTPTNALTLTSLYSKPLLLLLKHMLQESDNLYADSLTKQLALSLKQEGTFKQGVFAIKQILGQHTTVDQNQLILSDGCGTHYDATTPEQVVALLLNLYHDTTLYPLMREALPHMGISGNLKDRLKGSVLENKVIAKTGTFHDVSALSGYLMLANGKTLVFSILINNVEKNIQLAKQLENKILLAVYTGDI